MNRTLFNKSFTAALLLLLCLAAAGCGQKSVPEAALPEGFVEIGGQVLSSGTTDLTILLSDGETAQLEKLPNLHFADLSGSENVEEIAAWAKAHPEVDVSFRSSTGFGVLITQRTKRKGIPSITISVWYSVRRRCSSTSN